MTKLSFCFCPVFASILQPHVFLVYWITWQNNNKVGNDEKKKENNEHFLLLVQLVTTFTQFNAYIGTSIEMKREVYLQHRVKVLLGRVYKQNDQI
jgi:hypothetical protein